MTGVHFSRAQVLLLRDRQSCCRGVKPGSLVRGNGDFFFFGKRADHSVTACGVLEPRAKLNLQNVPSKPRENTATYREAYSSEPTQPALHILPGRQEERLAAFRKAMMN